MSSLLAVSALTGASTTNIDKWITAVANALAALAPGDKLIIDGLGKLGFTTSGNFSYSGPTTSY